MNKQTGCKSGRVNKHQSGCEKETETNKKSTSFDDNNNEQLNKTNS